MAEDGEEKSDLKITNYRGWGLGEGGKGGKGVRAGLRACSL